LLALTTASLRYSSCRPSASTPAPAGKRQIRLAPFRASRAACRFGAGQGEDVTVRSESYIGTSRERSAWEPSVRVRRRRLGTRTRGL